MEQWYEVVQRSCEPLAQADELAYQLAAVAVAQRPVDEAAAAMVGCRLVDNAAVAIASLARRPVQVARRQALSNLRDGGATLIGLPSAQRVSPEWAAWANGTAVRELDFHDTFLAADYAHPGDSINALVAVAQACGRDGATLQRAVLVAYEVHVALVKAISLHAYKKDHVGHLAPAIVAGLGNLLSLPHAVVYHAINQAVHLSFSTRQSRKGRITSWKAFVPGFAGKLAIECIDRAMRGEHSPNPIYEGEDGVLAWMLGGADDRYEVVLPEPGEAAVGIVETYTKAHSAEYQAQALIDLAIDMGSKLNTANIREVVLHTSHHTHYVIGTGSNDPQKWDPDASRETLDHSIAYILAVALEDGAWHHERSYSTARAHQSSTIALWNKVRTVEDEQWTRRYGAADPAERAFGGLLEIRMDDGSVVSEERAVADAHPNGTRPWGWDDYVGKFSTLTASLCADAERSRFLESAARLADLCEAEVCELYPVAHASVQDVGDIAPGIFDYPR